MSDYESNYEYNLCPFCYARIGSNKNPEGGWVYDLDDEGEDFFQCHKCDKFFKASLNIRQEYNYSIRKPTKEEVKEYGLIANKDLVEDLPGQRFMWQNLFLDES
jgi:uncharacterized C2H2 Zn-finger protein